METKPILLPRSISEKIKQQAKSRVRGFEADYIDGAHDLYVLLTHLGLIKKRKQ